MIWRIADDVFLGHTKHRRRHNQQKDSAPAEVIFVHAVTAGGSVDFLPAM